MICEPYIPSFHYNYMTFNFENRLSCEITFRLEIFD